MVEPTRSTRNLKAAHERAYRGSYGAVPILFLAWLLDSLFDTRLADWFSHSNTGQMVLVVSGAAVVTYLVRRGEIGTR
jgi:hypothetical protein